VKKNFSGGEAASNFFRQGGVKKSLVGQLPRI